MANAFFLSFLASALLDFRFHHKSFVGENVANTKNLSNGKQAQCVYFQLNDSILKLNRF